MADFVYNNMKKRILDGLLDLDTGGTDLRCILLEAATDEDKDDDSVADVLGRAGTTELSSTGYVTIYDHANGGNAFTGEVSTVDDTDDEGVADIDDVVWSNISQVGVETVVALLVYQNVDGTQANDLVVAFVDSFTPNPLTPNGSSITWTIPAEGWLNLNDA